MTSLDNQTISNNESQLFNEIVSILTSVWRKYGKASLVAYIPFEGPMTFTYELEGHKIKGVFHGDYTKKTLRNLVNMLEKDESSSVKVTSRSHYSYQFSTVL